MDRCKAEVDSEDGAIRVRAADITGNLRWGETSARCGASFFNEAECIVGDRAKNCTLAQQGTVAARRAPADCTIDICDDSATTCEAHIKGCKPRLRRPPRGWVDARDYGVKCDNSTDDTRAIMAAIDAVPSTRGEVHLPSGNCLVTGLEIVDKKVTLVGRGGSCQVLAIGHPENPDGLTFCGTVLRSTTPTTIVKFAVKNRTDAFQSRFWVGLRDLAIQGHGDSDFSRFDDQHCLHLDNRGFVAYNVTVAQWAGHGLYLTDAAVWQHRGRSASRMARGSGLETGATTATSS